MIQLLGARGRADHLAGRGYGEDALAKRICKSARGRSL
jgi:hypothetical protein